MKSLSVASCAVPTWRASTAIIYKGLRLVDVCITERASTAFSNEKYTRECMRLQPYRAIHGYSRTGLFSFELGRLEGSGCRRA